MSLTRTFSGISLKIVFAFAGSALTFSGTAASTPTGTMAGWPAESAASHPATSRHMAAADVARLSRSLILSRTRQVRSRAPTPGPRAPGVEARAPTVELAASAAVREWTPRQAARHLMQRRFHWKRWQFKYLNRLWARESGWNRYASNPYSGAYGIPQATPGNKMASAGRNWRFSARTQILWGMRYIRARYRTPYWAWAHSRQYGWY